MSKETAEWIEAQYIEWQRRRKKHGSQAAFYTWLGVSRNTYNGWTLKKQTPTGDSLRLLGEKLGWEIYDIVGEPRPHPILQLTRKLWGRLTDDEIKRIEKILRGAEERSADAPVADAPKPKRASPSS